MVPLKCEDPRVFFFLTLLLYKKQARSIPARLIDAYYPPVELECIKSPFERFQCHMCFCLTGG